MAGRIVIGATTRDGRRCNMRCLRRTKTSPTYCNATAQLCARRTFGPAGESRTSEASPHAARQSEAGNSSHHYSTSFAFQCEDHIAAEVLQPGNVQEKLAIAPIQAGAESSLTQNAAGHRQQLKSLQANARKQCAQVVHLASLQGPFVGSAFLARIGQVLPGPVEERILSPGLTENSHTTG